MNKTLVLSLSILMLTLSACSSGTSAEPLPTVVIENAAGSPAAESTAPSVVPSGSVIASGLIIASQKAELAFAQPGIVQTVSVQVGDSVTAGTLLVELENASAKLEAEQARRALREMTSPAAIAAAEHDLAAAQQALKDAENDNYALLAPRASDTLLENTQAEIDVARDQLARASDAYRSVSKLPDGDSRKAAALLALTNAQLNLDRKVALYNWYTGTPSETDTLMLQSDLANAQAAAQEAAWYVAALKGESIPADATGPQLTALQNAQDRLIAAEQRLAQTRLISPVDGEVVAVNLIKGEYAQPGFVVVIVSNVQELHVETTDLSERDVPKVQVGQQVIITVEALGIEVPGTVLAISPVADTLGGDVVYKTTIHMDEIPENARAGMTVEVYFKR